MKKRKKKTSKKEMKKNELYFMKISEHFLTSKTKKEKMI